MPNATQYTFTHKELAEILVRKQNITEGHWGLYVKFGIQGLNISSSPTETDMFPAALVPILELGIQRFDAPNPLTVDAKALSPKPKKP